jgi:hypothetical protein
MRTVSRNHPIATVIKNYVNKKSGKVTDSRNEIQRRFYGLDWKDQKKIMAAFLDAGVSDRDWAYSRLLDLWDASFESKVLELWGTYHEEKCAWVIIRHFPKEFIRKHINTFNEGRDYYFICRRLAEDADFVVDQERLSKTDYLMALSHGERHIRDEEATDILYSIIQEICFHWCASMELSRNFIPRRDEMLVASDFANVSIALYYLEKMGNDNVVSEFHNWENAVQTSVRNSEEYKALVNESCSDYDYKEKFAAIVQKHLYYALPVKYKTMTDEEYDKKDMKVIEHTPSYNVETGQPNMALWMDGVEDSSEIIDNDIPF